MSYERTETARRLDPAGVLVDQLAVSTTKRTYGVRVVHGDGRVWLGVGDHTPPKSDFDISAAMSSQTLSLTPDEARHVAKLLVEAADMEAA